MGHRAGPPLLDGQPGLRAVERLDLALLVDAKHQGFVRRVEIKGDDVLNLLDERFVIGQLEF
ncbi:MAG: hypothetical protein E5W95_11120 [Mesorhizobium sp.]|nr:MAG: hypothetical protein E5W95_11120 [Mesorhizobium sp.]